MENLAKALKAELKPSNKQAEFFGKLFQARDVLHLRHLKPTSPGQLGSGWEHKVLGDLYDELLDLTDGLIESYQGYKGIITIEIPSSKVTDIVSYLEEFCKMIASSYSLFPESWIQNELDSIQKAVYSTLFKLKNLK